MNSERATVNDPRLKENQSFSIEATKGLSYFQGKLLAAAMNGRDPNSLAARRGCDLLTSEAVKLIPAANRRSAQASICRTFASLERRGLIERVRGPRWSGIKLTENALLTLHDSLK